MKKLLPLFICIFIFIQSKAGNGDSIFNMNYIHTLKITFPYPNFYDSLINTNTTDLYLNVDIEFNSEVYSNVGIKVKGNSSFNNPSQKKSFKIDMNEFISGQDIHGLKKLNFNNLFKDPSFMREKLVNDFLIAHDAPAPRTTYCNVYMNGQLWGLYTVVEEIDDEFCNQWFNSNDGNLFQGDPHGDLRWKGSATQSLYETEYELKNNSSTNDWSDLISLINVINNTPTSNLVAALDAKMNTSNFMKQWVVYNMFSSLDSYIGSGHNYYIYHDTVTNKFEWIAWDNNETFGSFKNGLTTTQLKNLDLYYLSMPSNKPLCNNMLANTEYKKRYENTYCELKQDFSNAYFDSKIDSLKNVIQTSVYADPKKFYSNGSFDSSINYDINIPGPGGIGVFGLKSFINDRSNFINNYFVTNSITCWPNAVENYDFLDEDIRLYPNPFIDKLTIQSKTIIQKIEMFDLTGRLIQLPPQVPQNQLIIDLSKLAQGSYQLRINGGITHKIIK